MADGIDLTGHVALVSGRGRGLGRAFAQGLAAAGAAVVDLLLFLASGRADPLSGRFLNVSDDLEQRLARQREIVARDLYTLRLRT